MTDYKQLCAELAALAKRKHYYCEDSWYSCPKATDGCADDSQGADCNCGADAHNAKVDELLVALAEPAPEGPTDEELRELLYYEFTRSTGHGQRVDEMGFARAVLARWGRPTPQVTPEASDGYHTFAELYEHRHALMLALMHSLPSLSWFSRRHADGELPFGNDQWFIVGVQLPVGPITYHLPIRLWDLARKTGAKELQVGKPWDGHTADEVVSRLVAWASGPALQAADAEVAELATAEMVRQLRTKAATEKLVGCHYSAELLTRAADLLERLSPPQPIPVSERLPKPEDCNVNGYCWWWYPEVPGKTYGYWAYEEDAMERAIGEQPVAWLPADAMSLFA